MTPPAPRVLIVHFTAPPAIGGVENLIAAQARVLRERGATVTVAAGEGGPSEDYRLAVIPELGPAAHPVRPPLAEKAPSSDDHPLVRTIRAALERLLLAHDQIWVHNALTVYLNPYLTGALWKLRGEYPEKRWVAFCHDFSSLSRYWHGSAAGSRARLGEDEFNATYVVLSDARRAELAALLHMPEREIAVIPPPLDLLQWLGVGEEARRIAVATGWLERDLTLLIPSKLLPHKRLDCVIGAVRALRRSGKDGLAVVTAAPSAHEPSVSAALACDLGALAHEAGVGDRFYLGTELLGHPPGRETVRDLMSLADLVFLPSAEEGYGTPISEAVALRVPLLCADIPAFREAGGAYAEYIPDVTNGDAVAARMVALSESPAANRRREVLRSMARFREAILNLAAAT